MKRQSTWLACVTLLFSTVLMLSVSVTNAADKINTAANATSIAPYLDDQSYAIVRIDLSRIRVAPVLKEVTKLLGFPLPPSTTKDVARIDRALDALRKAKAKEVFVLINLANIPHEVPAVLVSVGKGGDYETIATIMDTGTANPPLPNPQANVRSKVSLRLGNMVFQGKKNVFERLKKVKPVARPNLAKAFQAAGDTAVQLVFLPGTDHRRILTEMLPEIPKIAGGGSGRDLVDELQWASLGLNLPPKASAQLTIQSRNPVAARSLKKRIEIGLNLLANHPEFRKLINPIEPLRKLLTPQVVGNRLTLTVNAEGKTLRMIAAMFTGPIFAARKAAQRSSSMNNLKQLGLAMHNFHDVYKSFPPHASYTKKGKRLLSWRVYLLPYLDNVPLFREFHLDEAWDSPHNKKLIAKMPKVFASPNSANAKNGQTRYLAPVGKSMVFNGTPIGLSFRTITDGTSNTIMFVEVDEKHAIPWTKPEDLEIDLKKPLTGLVDKNRKGFLVSICDGSVRFISKNIDLKTLRALLTRNGREVVGKF